MQNKTNRTLSIVYACNDKYFEGLYLSILSILNRSKNTFNFYCLTATLTEISANYQGLSKYHENLLKKLVKKYNPKNTFKVIDCSKKYYEVFRSRDNKDIRKYTPYTMLRLMIDDFKFFKGILLYIDTDTMINGNIAEAFNVEMKGFELCACHDRNMGKKNNNMYFNAGVLLLNIDQIRKTNYLKKALNYYLQNKPKLADQTALNQTWTNIKFWPNEYRFNYQKPRIEADTIIKHFLDAARVNILIRYIKQWDIQKVQKRLKIHYWDEDYAFFLNEKSKWKS